MMEDDDKSMVRDTVPGKKGSSMECGLWCRRGSTMTSGTSDLKLPVTRETEESSPRKERISCRGQAGQRWIFLVRSQSRSVLRVASGVCSLICALPISICHLSAVQPFMIIYILLGHQPRTSVCGRPYYCLISNVGLHLHYAQLRYFMWRGIVLISAFTKACDFAWRDSRASPIFPHPSRT